MRAPVLFAVLLAACSPPTQLRVRVDSDAVELRRVQITVTNPTRADRVAYQSGDLTLCTVDRNTDCVALPITLTLVPGEALGDVPVRVQVDAFTADAAPVISDAATFRFVAEQTHYLDFVLGSACLGSRCAETEQACMPDATCGTLFASDDDRPLFDGGAPADQSPAPDLAPPVVTRISSVSGMPAPDGNGQVQVAPPANAQPGDLVILMIDFWAASQPMVAGADESTNTAAYRFLAAGQPAPYTLLVYRNASAPSLLTSSPPSSPFGFAAATTAANGIVLDVIASDVPRTCTNDDPGFAQTMVWHFVELRANTAGAVPPQTIDCAGGSGALFQLAITP
jgi:hypothetical protein